jgi:serpin B
MKSIRFTSSVVIGLMILVAQPVRPQTPALSPATVSLVKGNNAFALELYGRLAREQGNLFFSPYSISNALAMTYAGARGKTAQEMASTLHFDVDAAQLHPAWGELIRRFASPDKKRTYKLNVANRLWGQKDYGFLPAFLKIARDNYGAGLNELDFERATEDARRTINAWVEKETQDKIKDLIPTGALLPDTRLVLTNAIYFKAAWLEPFNKDATRKGDFQVGRDKKVPASFMVSHEAFPLFQTDSFQLLELPYESRDLSMLIFLPRKADGLAALEKLLTSARLQEWLGKSKTHMVDLKLPKFKITAEFKLKETLSEMGMPTAFSNRADFGDMSTREKLFIDAVLHKAYVDVHEKGTEAAAATAVIIRPTSKPNFPRAVFHADHPFTFLIRENRTGSILFMGRLDRP